METTTLTIAEADQDTESRIIKTDVAGRVRVSRERREELLDLFERSAMSGAAFARHYVLRIELISGGIAELIS